MVSLPVAGLERELALINQKLDKCFRLKSGHVGGFISIEWDKFDRVFYPMLVLLSAKSVGTFGAKVLELAAATQLIVLANRLHRDLPEEPGRSVLVGDYLYSCFNQILCSSGNIDLLEPLAGLIQDLSKLSIRQIEERLPLNLRDAQQESLIAGMACGIAAGLGLTSQEDVKRLKSYGENLGYAWAWRKSGKENLPPEVCERLERAGMAVQGLTPTSVRECIEARQNLIALAQWIANEFSVNKRYMVG